MSLNSLVLNALLFLNGTADNVEKYQEHIEQADKIICVDGGLNIFNRICNNADKIDYLVGDLDSADPKEIQKLPPNKIIKKLSQDITDLAFAINFINKFAIKKLTIIGATGGRFDQTIGNILELRKLKNINIKLVTDREDVFIVKDKVELKNMSGKTLSVLALGKAHGVTYTGMKWPLNNYDFPENWTGAMSNVIIDNHASVSVKSGEVLVFVNDNNQK